MDQATTLDYVMCKLWGDDDVDFPKEAIAIAAYVKNHRVNEENLFEIMRIMWPDAKMTPRFEEAKDPGSNEEERLLWDVIFKDGSKCLIVSNRGIGDAMEIY